MGPIFIFPILQMKKWACVRSRHLPKVTRSEPGAQSGPRSLEPRGRITGAGATLMSTSREGLFRPLSLDAPCQDQVTLSPRLTSPLREPVLPVSLPAISLLTKRPHCVGYTVWTDFQHPLAWRPRKEERPPLSIEALHLPLVETPA